MPYYHWKGVNLSGRLKTGRIFAASDNALDFLLFKRDIALISYSIALPWITCRAIKKETVMQFFERLAVLSVQVYLCRKHLRFCVIRWGMCGCSYLLMILFNRFERGHSFT